MIFQSRIICYYSFIFTFSSHSVCDNSTIILVEIPPPIRGCFYSMLGYTDWPHTRIDSHSFLIPIYDYFLQGDYIEHTLGLFMCISTMAAAALGNTISDVIGIGSAFYVEKLAEMIGVKPPKMTPLQLELKTSRRAANMVWWLCLVRNHLLRTNRLNFH